MKTLTKEQVIELVRTADGVLISTNAGEMTITDWDELIEYSETLKDMHFDGFVPADKAPTDITGSPYYTPEWGVYKFSDPYSNTVDGDIYINIGE
ncbi:hypothetical protein [Porphyromonas endodontalis]|uniref:hypothetical protein n=1 Tax=Porphyromonas endodontalis TaxID=28124 RepID=UPI0028E1F367|nr:hypothetical protein [Porphyromonas endodontalis]